MAVSSNTLTSSVMFGPGQPEGKPEGNRQVGEIEAVDD